jgi:hypothetical protein
VVSYLVKPVSLAQLQEKMPAEILSDPDMMIRVRAAGS